MSKNHSQQPILPATKLAVCQMIRLCSLTWLWGIDLEKEQSS